jgi:hypothetical protein
MNIQHFELTTIQENAFIYDTHLRNVSRRREAWSSEVKERIVQTLEAVKKNFPRLGWKIIVIDSMVNFETVILKIADVPSGISAVDKGKKKIREFIKTGGSLGFSQLVSGKIRVWFEYPFTEGIQEKKEPVRDMITIEPSYVNEVLIADYVKQFLHEITVYESTI